MRFATYNVRGLRQGIDKVTSVLRSLRADVVCVQEAPRGLRWRSRCAALARRSGLLYVTGGRTGAGTMLMCSARTAVVYREDFPLPRTPGLHTRGLAIAVFDIAGSRLVAGSMHLGLESEERLRHLDLMVRRMESLARKHDAPYVLGGDVNERQDGPAWQQIAGLLTDGHAVAPQGGSVTFGRHSRIDGVFASRDLKVVGCGVPDADLVAEASDHRPVLAELRTR